MVRRILLPAAFAALLALPASAPAATCAGAETRLSLTTIASARDAVLCLVNNERAARGLKPLVRDGRLELAAQLHSDDMVIRDFFDHTNLAGMSPFDRMELAGYEFSSAGENIAAGQPTPREAMEGWMASDGHCRNILSDQFTELGVGINLLAATIARGTGTWTQNFGRPQGERRPANPDVADECPVDELVTPDAAVDTADGPSFGGDAEETPIATDFPSGTPSKLTAVLRRTARRLIVRGRLAAANGTRVRILIRRGRQTVFRTRTRLRNGRYAVRIKTPADAGRLTVVVRAAGQRATRTSAGR